MSELRVPVRINNQCKDERLHGRIGDVLMSKSEPWANSYIVDIGEEFHCQLGSWGV